MTRQELGGQHYRRSGGQAGAGWTALEAVRWPGRSWVDSIRGGQVAMQHELGGQH